MSNITTKSKYEGWSRVLMLIIPYIFIVGAFQLLGSVIAGANLSQKQHTAYEYVVISIFDCIGTFLVLYIFMKYVDKEKFVKLGFHTKNKLKDFIVGNLLGFISISVGFVILLYFNEIIFEKFFFNKEDMFNSIVLFAIVAVVEETLFRGYILKNLLLSFNKYVAIIISSVLFALAHGANPNLNPIGLIDLFLAGVLFGIPYVYTKNLWLVIALHFSWNFFQTHFGFNVSGQDFYSLIETSIITENHLNGGYFGFEGSILAVISEVLLIVLFFMYYEKRKNKNLSF